MSGQVFEYKDDTTVCEGYAVTPPGAGKKPCVLIAHQWAGIIDHERSKAAELAKLGYVGIAIDVYGQGTRGDPNGDNSALIGPFLNDRAKLLKRLMAAVTAAKAHPSVDAPRIALIGYCFGGLCALDVARSGTDHVRGVVSLHGLFGPSGLPAQTIKAKVLALHGWDDPLVPPKDVLALSEEMTKAKADWQLHAYGHTVHAFTARGREFYSPTADRRSWAATTDFLAEIFA